MILNRNFLPFFFRLHCKDNRQQMLCVSISVQRRKVLHLYITLVRKEVVCNNIQLWQRWRMGRLFRFVRKFILVMHVCPNGDRFGLFYFLLYSSGLLHEYCLLLYFKRAFFEVTCLILLPLFKHSDKFSCWFRGSWIQDFSREGDRYVKVVDSIRHSPKMFHFENWSQLKIKHWSQLVSTVLTDLKCVSSRKPLPWSFWEMSIIRGL